MFQPSNLRRAGALVIGILAVLSGLYAWQKPFREYQGLEYARYPVPPNPNEKTEWVFARLMYPPVPARNGGVELFGSWKEGGSNWAMDYPRSDRHLARALQRLTRIHVRSTEETEDLDERDVFDRPWLYGVEVGHWDLTDAQAKAMREYLLRGGFFMCDDFHGTVEWSFFEASMRKVFPDRSIVEIEAGDPIFHGPYNITERIQVPGKQFLETGQIWERDGKIPHWRAIYDDRGRIMVAICFNMDLGDSWEHADDPQYPANFSDLGIRTAVNYVVYSMTH